MRLTLRTEQVHGLLAALQQAGKNEIGGQMFGEQLAPSDFVVTDLTFQHRPGSLARFVVDLVQAAREAIRFFDRTDHRYTRFNYIGEWHSHPSFEVRPSSTDVGAMRSVVHDPDFRGNFAVLMIVRLDDAEMVCGGWIFDPDGAERPIQIQVANG